MQNDKTMSNEGLADGAKDQEPGVTLAGNLGATADTEMGKKAAVKGAAATGVPGSLASTGSADAARKVATPELPGRNEQQANGNVNNKEMPDKTNVLKPHAESIAP